MLYLAESARNMPKLDSHHHVKLESNLVLRGWIYISSADPAVALAGAGASFGSVVT
jgi:hypothetical protein